MRPAESRDRFVRLHRFLTPTLLAALLGLLPSAAVAQGQLPAPQPVPEGKAPVDFVVTDIITLGTTADRVTALLGSPRGTTEIFSLGRRMIAYQDGTKVVFVHDRAISATPGGLASGNALDGYVVERPNNKVFLDPMLLCGNAAPPPLDEIKRQVEADFLYAPKVFVPPTPPLAPLPHHPAFFPLHPFRVY